MSRRILLADDSVTIQKVIELTFMDGDFAVTAVSNGDEALAKLPEVQPDLVIADVHMPGANGYEVCRRTKAERPSVPVLLLVGTFEPFDEAQARAVGADAHLKKPFDSQELLSLAQQLLDRSAGTAPAPAAAAAVPLASFEAPEPTWGNFDLNEPEPEPVVPAPAPAPAPAPLPAAPAPHALSASAPPAEGPAPAAEAVRSAGFNWSEPLPLGRVGEQTFELDDTNDALGIDDSLLHDEPVLEAPGMDEPFDIGALEPAESPFALPTAPPPEASGFAAPPSADERAGVPLGAAPLTSGLDEIEQHVHWAAEAAHETPPAEVPATPAPSAVSVAAAAPSAPAAAGAGELSESEVDRIARRVVELLGDRTVRDIAWEVIPDMAELVIKDRLRELESQVE